MRGFRNGRRVPSGHAERDQDRDLLLGRRVADEVLLSAGSQGRRGAAPLLRRPVRRGRGELDLLPAAGRAHGPALGRAHARGVRHAREGLRRDDAAPGQGRAAAARPARGGAARLARPRRPAAARVPGRGLPPLPRGARAVAGDAQARRDPDAAAALHRLQALGARVPRVGEGAARRRRDAGRVPARELARRGEPQGDARLPRAQPHDLRDRRRAADGGAQRLADGRRHHEPDRVHPLPRPQRRDLEQAHRQRGRALRLPLLRGRAARVGRAAGRALRPGGERLRDVQQQRPLDDAGPADARQPRRGGHRDRAGAGQRADAAPAARARRACRSRRRPPLHSIRAPWSPGRTSSPAASTSMPSRARC